MVKQLIKICDWCRNTINDDAPMVQNSSVDAASVLGRAKIIVSTVRSYHTIEPPCYQQMLHNERMKADKVAATPAADANEAGVVSGEITEAAFEWSDAFGMSAGEALSGSRKTLSRAASPYISRISRLTKRRG